MNLPLKFICQEKDMRNDGTSIIYIQYCYAPKKRTTLNTEIAIPPRYWHQEKCFIKDQLPGSYGKVEELSASLRKMMRMAEDLVELANQKEIKNKGSFVKAV